MTKAAPREPARQAFDAMVATLRAGLHAPFGPCWLLRRSGPTTTEPKRRDSNWLRRTA